MVRGAVLCLMTQLNDLGDGKADFLIVDQNSGATTAYLNGGPNSDPSQGYVWLPVNGQIASGIGRDGKGIRFADIK